jgi:hypothetical protein
MITSHSTENIVMPRRAVRWVVAGAVIWGFIIGVTTCLVVSR